MVPGNCKPSASPNAPPRYVTPGNVTVLALTRSGSCNEREYSAPTTYSPTSSVRGNANVSNSQVPDVPVDEIARAPSPTTPVASSVPSRVHSATGTVPGSKP